MLVSIIIRSYNEEKYIGKLVKGIKSQNIYDPCNIEILLVDSGSEDNTVEIAKDLGVKIYKIKKSDFSFGRALNIGCKNATGEFLVFVSAHVYPIFSDWLSNLISLFENDRIGLVYGRQIGGESSKFSEKMIFNSWFPSISNLNQKTPFCNNANCAIRRSLWIHQPFDEELTGLEDIDWANKIMVKGYRLVYNADAAIVHLHDETPQKIKNRYRREAIAFKHIMPDVHVGFLGFIKLFISNTFSDAFHAIQKGCFWKELKNIVVFRFMQFYGTYLGHQQKGAITKELKYRFYYPNALTKHQDEVETISKKASKRILYT